VSVLLLLLFSMLPEPKYVTGAIRRIDGETVRYSDGRIGELYADRACPCGQSDDAAAPATLGHHEFLVIRPVGWDPARPAPTVLHMVLTGGAFGWIDRDGKYSGKPGTYMGDRERATAAWNRKRIKSVMNLGPRAEWEIGGRSQLAARLRERHPDWTFLIPSNCSHDLYAGRGAGADFPRFGWIALVNAIKYVRETSKVSHMFAEGVSAGGSGCFFLARDLERALPGSGLRGIVMDSQVHEPAALVALYDAGKPRDITLPDGRRVQAPCSMPGTPLRVGFGEAALRESASADIRAGKVAIPLFHLWNRRDQAVLCSDEAYGDRLIHGPVARAIAARNPGGRSMYRRTCVTTPESTIPCNAHGLLSRDARDEEAGDRDPDYVAEILAWIERLDADRTAWKTKPPPYGGDSK